ncbi:hypothetical protein G6F42_019700 [Rhizopus arrhizus]|nr:hypothetical protein G6F42_019700 [Rhizopus arrhizus]
MAEAAHPNGYKDLTLIADDVARQTFHTIGDPKAGYAQFQPITPARHFFTVAILTDTRNVTKTSQGNIDAEIADATSFEKDTKRRKNDGW